MLRRIALLSFALLLVLQMGLPVYAQEGDASTAYQLNMRTGPGTGFAVIVTLPAGTALALEARNEDISWVLTHTLDGAWRGWVASLYLRYAPGVSAARLPVSEEIIGGAAPAAPEAAAPAPEGMTASPRYQLNVRSGPGTGHSVLGQVRPGTVLIPEARNADASWVLAHTQDGALRGWLASLYLAFRGGSAFSLPLSDEILPVGAGVAPAAPAAEASLRGHSPGRTRPLARGGH
ncbi:MAG: hypothetical protein KatS3mg051_0766 [Anaerolineae bacterium]|nr:MAG: hypothetical protein KatS3mg051_0766 [Anaerolineae bacterium]